MKAAFVGMTATTSKKELVRATLNSLVYQIADILAEFQKLPPQLNNEIHTDGSMIHNQYLMQYLSNITQRTVKISNISELSALGSAMNAFQDMSGSKSSASYSPRMKKDVALNYFDEWHNWIEKMS